jgi:CPA1 family monovalent cation:H+ antiporter
MSAFDLAAVFLFITALVGWFNARFWRKPAASVMVIVGLLAAGALQGLSVRYPGGAAYALIREIRGVDFPRALIGYMLAFLLFAGAMQVDIGELRRRRVSVVTLATVGVVLSTLLVGFGLVGVSGAVGRPIGIGAAIVFGALISPTDPIAVIAAVRTGGLSDRLRVVLQGEALFNDGVGLVVFTAAVAIFMGGADPIPPFAVLAVGAQTLGGLGLGFALAWVCVEALRGIDDFAAEIILTLALATGVYALAGAIGVSGPIAVVVAGLVIGGEGYRVMTVATQELLRAFWTLIDELLNAVLFLLLGLQLLVVHVDMRNVGLWIAAFGLVLLARFLVVVPWGVFFRFRSGERGASLLLGWGGLHGALSLALALGLPLGPDRQTILQLTFAVVIASVLLQGMTFSWLSRVLGVRSQRRAAP